MQNLDGLNHDKESELEKIKSHSRIQIALALK